MLPYFDFITYETFEEKPAGCSSQVCLAYSSILQIVARYHPPKRRFTYNILHIVISKNTKFFIETDVRISILA
jgi:hypothetical protein